MKFSIFALIILLLISCKTTQITELDPIPEFEKILGKQETLYLNHLVEDFELYLDSIYGNKPVNAQYKEYLQKIAAMYADPTDPNIIWKPDSTFLFRVKTGSDLLGKYDFPDSVVYDPPTSFLTYNNGDTSCWIDYLAIPPQREVYLSNSQADSIVSVLENELVQLEEGKFFSALGSVRHNDDFVNHYVKEIKNSYNGIGISLISYGLSKADLNDYFIKRIIVIESILRECVIGN